MRCRRRCCAPGVAGPPSTAARAPRAWLYRIVTTTCIDLIRQSGRQVRQLTSFAEVPWLQPYPDTLLDRAADDAEQPERAVIARETIELAYLAVIQLLPARQRAVLLLRDVQGYSAADTAAILDLTVPAANSALQRARQTLRERTAERDADWSPSQITDADRDLLTAFIDAHTRQDTAASLALLRKDVRVSSDGEPPNRPRAQVLRPGGAETALRAGDQRGRQG